MMYNSGVDKDLNPNVVLRDTTPLYYKIFSVLSLLLDTILVISIVFFIAMPFVNYFLLKGNELIFPYEGIFFAVLVLFFLEKMGRIQYPLKVPVYEKIQRKNDKPGIIYIGKNTLDGTNIYKDLSTELTHTLAIGTTGSGKTRYLLSILFQAVMLGSGSIYIDGKADTELFFRVYSFCRRLNRLDDLFAVNFIACSKGVLKSSNSVNIFANADAPELVSILVSLLDDAGSEGQMWQGRAISLLNAILYPLCEMRDKKLIHLNVQTLRNHLTLDAIVALYKQATQFRLTASSITNLGDYLFELPGLTKSVIEQEGAIDPEAFKQHGYLQMQFSRALGELSLVYKRIFMNNYSEIDFKDAILSRKIVIVLLPSLTKDPQALAQLGKLIVGLLKSSLGPTLGTEIEGASERMLDSKPTNDEIPYFFFFDEVGYYTAAGMSMMAAQLRGCGIACYFGTQDTPSLERTSKIEASGIKGNTKTTICMTIEDAEDTANYMIKRAGEGYQTSIEGMEVVNNALTISYKNKEHIKVEKVNRINIRDLTKQKAGEAHIIINDHVFKSNLVYIDYPLKKVRSRLLRLVGVKPVDYETVQEFKKQNMTLVNQFDANNKTSESKLLTFKVGIQLLEYIDLYSNKISGLMPLHQKMICALSHQEIVDRNKDNILISQYKPINDEEQKQINDSASSMKSILEKSIQSAIIFESGNVSKVDLQEVSSIKKFNEVLDNIAEGEIANDDLFVEQMNYSPPISKFNENKLPKTESTLIFLESIKNKLQVLSDGE